jgi:hypothetical protein
MWKEWSKGVVGYYGEDWGWMCIKTYQDDGTWYHMNYG